MSTFTIGEIAELKAFSASSLRYYEGIGLVVPVARTDAGYRLYDEGSVARLAFIARAKDLGCTLEEIADLVAVWDDERCGPVQRHLHALVTEKVGATRRQLAELSAFSRQLQEAATHLAGEPTDGPCEEGCACLPPVVADHEPIACTLPAGAVPGRVEEWRALLAHVSARTTTADGSLRLALDPGIPLDELARLVAAEQGCCAFFAFAITVDARGLALEVSAPAGAGSMVEDLFGAAA